MSSDKQFLIRRGGKTSGPFKATELRELAKSGKLRPTDELSQDNGIKWVPATSVKGLIPATTPVATVPHNEEWFYADAKGERQGPVTLAELQRILQSRGLGTRIWAARLDGWKKASEVPEFAMKSTGTPPPLLADGSREKHRTIGTYVFGSLLLTFFVGVFVFSPNQLPEFKQRMLAISSALLAGLFCFFLTGMIKLKASGIKTGAGGEVGIQAAGGAAAFVLVLVWWFTPFAPVQTESGESKQVATNTNDDPLTSGLAALGIDAKVSPEARAAFEKAQKQAQQLSEEASGKVGAGVAEIQKGVQDTVSGLTNQFATRVDWANKNIKSIDFAALDQYTVMSALVLSGATFDVTDVKLLADLSNLRDLAINRTSIGDAQLPLLAKMRDLETLDLSETRITDAGLKMLGSMGDLRSLKLDGNALTGTGLTDLAKANSLNNLSLRACKIDPGLLKNLPTNLSQLDLGQTPLTDAGLKQINLKYLEKLFVDGTQVTDAGVRELEDRLTRVKVIRTAPTTKQPTPMTPTKNKTPMPMIPDVNGILKSLPKIPR